MVPEAAAAVTHPQHYLHRQHLQKQGELQLQTPEHPQPPLEERLGVEGEETCLAPVGTDEWSGVCADELYAVSPSATSSTDEEEFVDEGEAEKDASRVKARATEEAAAVLSSPAEAQVEVAPSTPTALPAVVERVPLPWYECRRSIVAIVASLALVPLVLLFPPWRL